MLVSDAPTFISPGVLCREYISEHCSMDTPITMSGATCNDVITMPLSELLPHPPLFKTCHRDHIVKKAEEF